MLAPEAVKLQFCLRDAFGQMAMVDISEIDYILAPRREDTTVYMRDGTVYTGDPIKTLVHPFAKSREIRDILDGVAVKEPYTYRDANGENQTAYDRRSAESYIAGPRPL